MPSVYYVIEIPEDNVEIPKTAELPAGWNAKVASAASRDFGTKFLELKRAAGLVLPTAIVPVGQNIVVNPSHPDFDIKWVSGPFLFSFDGRLT